jgi:hypothetical protein
MLFTAVPWHTVPETLRDAGPLKGKVVVDCTNPLTSDMGLAVGCTASAAEETAKLFPEAIVVKGFNTIFAAHYLSGDLGSGEQRLNMFFRGDDVAAKKKVGGIIESLGLIPVDAGPLSSARYIEPLGVFMVRLAFVQGMGIRIGWKLVNYTSSVVSSASAK